jgi:hypothetical protein
VPDEVSLLNLADDFEEANACAEAAPWNLRVGIGLEVFSTMRSAKFPAEQFQARLSWSTYPGDPPSLKFVEQGTERMDVPTAWPAAPGFRPASVDACVSWCAEGFGLHPEWRNDPRYRWDSRGNVLLKVLRILQDVLDEQCTGRFRP